MPNRAVQLTVSTMPVRITGDDDFRLDQRIALRVTGADIYIGGDATVTTTTGFLVKSGEGFEDVTDGDIYAVAASPATVYVYRGGVK